MSGTKVMGQAIEVRDLLELGFGGDGVFLCFKNNGNLSMKQKMKQIGVVQGITLFLGGFNLSHFKCFKHRDAGSNSESSNKKEMVFLPTFLSWGVSWSVFISLKTLSFLRKCFQETDSFGLPPLAFTTYKMLPEDRRHILWTSKIQILQESAKHPDIQHHHTTPINTILSYESYPNKNCRPPPATDFGDGSGLQRDVQKGRERIQCDHCGINVVVDVPRFGSGIIKVPNVKKTKAATRIPWEQF